MPEADISLVIIDDISGNPANIDIPRLVLTNNTILAGEFSIGQIYPHTFQRHFIKKRKNTLVRSIKKSKCENRINVKIINKEDKFEEEKKDPAEISKEIYQYLPDVNPYYAFPRIEQMSLITYKCIFSFIKNPSLSYINIIIPIDKKNLLTVWTYNQIAYKSGTLFDWQVILGKLDINGTLFKFPTKKRVYINNKKFKPILNSDIYEEACRVFSYNQWVRWQLKRIVNAWINKKCKLRVIGEDNDIITCEPIPKKDQVRIISVRNRTEYVFSGNVLLKTVKSCLDGQYASIPNIKTPRNPYTNTIFTYGEMNEVYNRILKWCAKKGKALPGIIGLYREHQFRNNLVLRIHNNYVQINATHNYILNDDITGEFFIETIQILLEDFSEQLFKDFDDVIGYQHFRLWNKIEPKHHLLLCWKKLAADFWYYKQTEQFPREHWKNESSILVDTIILLRASNDKLIYIINDYNRYVLNN
jgi:hypothetical protein